MFPMEIYELLIIVDVILFLYAYIDIAHKFYGNIIALGVAALLSYMVALTSVSGSVVVNYSSVTVTGGMDYLQSPELMWFFIFVGLIQTAYTLYLGYDAYVEFVEQKRYDEENNYGGY